MIIKVDEYGYITDEVSMIDVKESNKTEENRIKFVTDIAAISRNNTKSKNPGRRYELLLKEASSNEIGEEKYASRPLEFIPVKIDLDNVIVDIDKVLICDTELTYEDFINNIVAHSYMKGKYLYTNIRALVNAGIEYEKIPYTEQEEFRVIKIYAPMFVIAHILTHTRISKISASDRLVDVEFADYWYPNDIEERMKKLNMMDRLKYFGFNKIDMISLEYLDKNEWSLRKTQKFFKKLGYSKEIYQRMPYYNRYKHLIIGGWVNDNRGFNHLLLERTSSWTQLTTKLYISNLSKFLDI